jgi:MFS superfamily sulfate permease-like transporter
MAYIESIAAGRVFIRHGDRRPVPNRELIALGVANLAGSFFRIIPAGGGTSQTAVNDKAGARTQLAEVVTAGIVLAALLFLSPLFSLMPQATLAAVVVASAVGLLSPKEFRAILRVRYAEFWWAVIAFAGVAVLGTLQGILVAVAISLMTLMYAANHPPIYALGRKPGTDAFRAATKADIGFTGNGAIRTGLTRGKTGVQTVYDVFAVAPLGYGVVDTTAGSALVTGYFTGQELKNILIFFLVDNPTHPGE